MRLEALHLETRTPTGNAHGGDMGGWGWAAARLRWFAAIFGVCVLLVASCFLSGPFFLLLFAGSQPWVGFVHVVTAFEESKGNGNCIMRELVLLQDELVIICRNPCLLLTSDLSTR